MEKIWLAPMAGITDRAFRMMCRQQGCAAAVTEMVSAKALRFGSSATYDLIKPAEGEGFLAVQLFGREPADMAWAANHIIEMGYPQIDINMGCPAAKIVSNGEGSALMREPELAQQVAKAVVVAADGVPVSVKIRSGWDEAHINAVEIAKRMEDVGVSMLTVHGRTRQMLYSGQASREVIGQVKSAISIPVLGNGDINEPTDALDMMRETGCDGVMVARGAMGNPWIFRRIHTLLMGDKDTDAPDEIERLNGAMEHFIALVADKGENVGVREMRKHACWYLKGMPSASKVRVSINHAVSVSQVEEILIHYTSYISAGTAERDDGYEKGYID